MHKLPKLKLFLFAGLTLIIIAASPQAIAATSEKVDTYKTELQINKDGTIDITETIEYDFGTAQKHGIYRIIPRSKTNKEGEKFTMGINNIKVPGHQTKVTKRNKEVEIKIGAPDRYVSGKQTYEIKYTVSGALTYFSDHDELYWNVVGNEWEIPIMKTQTVITFPQIENMQESVKSACFTGKKGLAEKNCAIGWIGDSSLAITTTGTLGVGEGMTLTTGIPKGVVAVLLPKKDQTDLIFRSILGVLALIIFVLNFIVPIKIFLRWHRERQKVKAHQRIVAAWFEPPEGKNGKALTPAETAGLVDKKTDNKAITATIINLAQKGFLKIKVKSKKDIMFEKAVNAENTYQLSENERNLLDGLFSNTPKGLGTILMGALMGKSDTTSQTSVHIKDLKNSPDFLLARTTFSQKICERLFAEGMFEENPEKIRKKYSNIAAASFFFLAPILAFVALFLGRKSAKRSIEGIQKYSEAVSLKNFLSSQEEQLDFQSQNQMFFEKLLPYATAFGVEKIWAERFKDLQFTQPDWYEGDFNKAMAFSSLSNSMGKTISAATTTTSSSGFSSGFSGGSSGGGGGGGGGGSW
jgi:uncharacterized membrane protein